MKSDDRLSPGRIRRRPLDLLLVLGHRVAAFHTGKNSIGTRLHRQVQMIHKLRHTGISLEQRVAELDRMRRGVADSVDAVDVSHVVNEFSEIRLISIDSTAIGVHILAQQIHFPHTLIGQRRISRSTSATGRLTSSPRV